MNIVLKEAKYIVSFRQAPNGTYNINHIRGDITFNVKWKRKLFNPGSTLHIWFELVNCKTESGDVKGFPKKERLPVHKVFSETKYRYDKDFWGDFNIILPEDKLKEFILNNFHKIIEEESD